MKGIVRYHQDVNPIQLGGGTERRILAYDDPLMAVEVSFETGSEGAPHTHPHTQMSYVLSGSFRYSVEDESVILNPGDSIVVPGRSGAQHCLPGKGCAAGCFHPHARRFSEILNSQVPDDGANLSGNQRWIRKVKSWFRQQ